MSLEFLSGLLLALAALAIVGYIVMTLVSSRATSERRGASTLREGLAKYVGSEAKPVNAHLIGAIGKVVSHSGDSSRPMRIRIGGELWPARLEASEAELPVGSSVAITAIDGPIMVVEARYETADDTQ